MLNITHYQRNANQNHYGNARDLGTHLLAPGAQGGPVWNDRAALAGQLNVQRVLLRLATKRDQAAVIIDGVLMLVAVPTLAPVGQGREPESGQMDHRPGRDVFNVLGDR